MKMMPVTTFRFRSWLAVLLTLFGLQALAQTSGQRAASRGAPVQTAPNMITTTTYPSGAETRILTLWSQEIQPLSGLDLLNYFSSHPGRTSFPNTAFMVVDSSAKSPSTGRIVWITYVFRDKQIRPQQNWSADFAHPPSADRAYVVLSKSTGWDVTLAVYSTALNQEIATFPIALDPQAYSRWPPSSEPLSQMNTTLIDKEVSGISRINVVAQRDYLLIFAEREHQQVLPASFRFDVNTKQWSELTFQPKEPVSEPRGGKKQ